MDNEFGLSKSILFEEAENTSTNVSSNPTFGDIIAQRLSRRDLIGGILAVSAMGATHLDFRQRTAQL